MFQLQVIAFFLPEHSIATLQHDQEEKLLLCDQIVLCSFPQIGRHTEPAIFILHRKFSLFMALIPT